MAVRKPRIPGNPGDIITRVRSLGTEEGRQGMMRFGIRPQTELLGVSVTALRSVARDYQTDHALAQELWKSGVHEVRILAGMLDDPDLVTPDQMDEWANAFDSWDICDQTCQNLFQYTLHAEQKSYAWVQEPNEFVKRAGLVLMAACAVGDHVTDDQRFYAFIPTLVENMNDERNFVKKAVSWSFRQIGKRNGAMRTAVLNTVAPLLESDDPTTLWIARDVTKELNDPKVRKKIRD
jgi:3-methyladenine DNA glycosylase AlkD